MLCSPGGKGAKERGNFKGAREDLRQWRASKGTEPSLFGRTNRFRSTAPLPLKGTASLPPHRVARLCPPFEDRLVAIVTPRVLTLVPKNGRFLWLPKTTERAPYNTSL
ncbi:hypothetical protein BaRGS_00037934 [Batillaria attramentaria]|uniref:Uncharacterized protein n=1 Tax=Batillaria attramentaria TaxID=370345 RepID=A0ABD0J7I7_9CAEN